MRPTQSARVERSRSIPSARVDRTLTIQRQAVGVFCYRDVREQTGTWPAALDRQRWQRRLHDGLAGPAAQLGPHQLDHLERGWDIFEQLGHVLAELAQHRAAAAGAGRRRLMHDALARQVRRQGFAAARLAVGRLGACRASRALCLGLLGAGLALRHAFLELAEQELELLDLAVELLRGTAEARSAQHRELRLEMLDLQRLGVELRVAHRDETIAFGEQRLLLRDELLALAQQRFLLDNHPPQRSGHREEVRRGSMACALQKLIRVEAIHSTYC